MLPAIGNVCPEKVTEQLARVNQVAMRNENMSQMEYCNFGYRGELKDEIIWIFVPSRDFYLPKIRDGKLHNPN